jgi:hypothetical protein
LYLALRLKISNIFMVLYWCRVRGLNSRPTVYKTAALPLS